MTALTFNIKQKTADKLVALMNEMYSMHENPNSIETLRFNQNNCRVCVIGNGIRAGIMNGFVEPAFNFNKAIEWLEISPVDKFDYNVCDTDNDYGLNIIGYLFGTDEDIHVSGKELGYIPSYKTVKYYLTPLDAINRIQQVLETAGYDLVDK